MPTVDYRARHIDRLRAYNTAYMRRYRAAHPERVKASRQAAYSKSRAFYDQLKNGKPCTDCGGLFPPFVMDFDHARGEKVVDVSKLRYVRAENRQRLLDEIAKCDLVCANCHRIRTMRRGRLFGGPAA